MERTVRCDCRVCLTLAMSGLLEVRIMGGEVAVGRVGRRTLQFVYGESGSSVHIQNLWRACQVSQSCLTLYNLIDCSPPGSSVHGILQARILQWVAFSPPGDLPDPGIKLVSLASPALAGRFFTTVPPGKPLNF